MHLQINSLQSSVLSSLNGVQKDPKKRLSANELMRHPFISMYDHLDIDLASYFTAVRPPPATF
nr:mitogen-activated protein kinase kinase 2-like [Ipomoea batatas]